LPFRVPHPTSFFCPLRFFLQLLSVQHWRMNQRAVGLPFTSCRSQKLRPVSTFLSSASIPLVFFHLECAPKALSRRVVPALCIPSIHLNSSLQWPQFFFAFTLTYSLPTMSFPTFSFQFLMGVYQPSSFACSLPPRATSVHRRFRPRRSAGFDRDHRVFFPSPRAVKSV